MLREGWGASQPGPRATYQPARAQADPRRRGSAGGEVRRRTKRRGRASDHDQRKGNRRTDDEQTKDCRSNGQRDFAVATTTRHLTPTTTLAVLICPAPDVHLIPALHVAARDLAFVLDAPRRLDARPGHLSRPDAPEPTPSLAEAVDGSDTSRWSSRASSRRRA